MSDARSGSQPGSRPAPPAPPLIGPTGSPSLDCMANAINSTIAPFQNAPPAEQGAAGWVAQGLGGVTGLVGAPAQIIDSAFAGLTAPIAALFPSMPAITLLGMHLGSLHAHTHPPSLIPPAPPIPLPSIGMVVGSGAISVLGGGMPLARAGDIGISVTCGSLAPPFEIFTGSSNVFVGGARAARILDITKHCNPTSMGPFDIAMGVAGVAAGAAGAVAANSAAAAAQAAADAAVLAIKLLCGKDPGLPPGMGCLLGPPVPTVLIGGFPCPPIGDMVIGALMKALKSVARAARALRSSRRGNANCADGSHPIYLVTGENFDEFCDFVSPGLFCWRRHYSTGRAEHSGPLGYGFRHFYQRRLDLRLHRAKFTDWDGVTLEFPKFEAGTDRSISHGYVLRRITRERYELSTPGEATMIFAGDLFTEVLPLVGLRSEDRELSLEYGPGGQLSSVEDRDSAGAEAPRRYILRHEPQGRIVAIDALGAEPSARFAASYNLAGELAYVRDANNGLWAYEYDAHHRWTRQVDPREYGYSFRYDDQGRCIYACGDDGLWRAEVEYFVDKRMTRYVEGEGAVWEYHYDKDGFITKIVNPQGAERLRVRDSEGKILEEIDAGGRVLTYLYDANGANLGRRDRFGFLHPTEAQTTALSDPFVRDLPATSLARTFATSVETSPEAMSGATGRLLEVPAELRRLAHSVFHMRAAGARTTPQKRRWCDALGNPVYEVDGLQRAQRRGYDAAGNEIAHLDRDGRYHQREIHSWNLLHAKIDPLGNTTRYAYNALEQVVALTDPLGNVTRWEYDPGQRLSKVWRDDRLRDVYTYDLGDRLLSKSDGRGRLIFQNLEFHDNQLVARRVLASGGEHRFDYDARGRLTEASTGANKIQIGIDFHGRRVHDLRDGEGIERLPSPQRTRLRVLGRFEWSHLHPSDGLTRIEAPNGQRSEIHSTPDGVVLRRCSNGTREWLQYDHEGRLKGRLSARRDSDGQHTGWGVRYTYSAHGDLLSVTDSARGTTTYEVDDAHRLVGEKSGDRQLRYEFDSASNLVASPSISRLGLGPGNQIDASATEVYEHDSRDRLSLRRHRDGPITRYSYDSFDFLVAVELELDRDKGASTQSWRAGYDAVGRRLWTEFEGARREFYWDGDRLAAEIDPQERLRIYLYADDQALVPLAFIDYEDREAPAAKGRLFHLFCDGAGAPLHIEDEHREIVWWAPRVDPWGSIEVHASATLEFNLRWPGHYYDAETGLHYNRYRYYDPGLGRYLTPDPIGYRGSEVNLYAYCPNPLVQVDVLGLTSHRRSAADGSDAHPRDTDGSDPPPRDPADPPEPPRRPPLMSHDDADAQVRTSTEQARRNYTADPSLSKADVGTVVAGAIDRRTGETFHAHNDRNGAPPENMHPIIERRVNAANSDPHHPSPPGSHAEVHALNDALNAREAAGFPVTEADLGEFTINPVWASGSGKGRMTPGDPAPRCGNCAKITDGTRNLSGDAPPWLPPYD